MSADDDHVWSAHSHRRASVYTAPEKSTGFPTYYNPLHKTTLSEDVYGIRPLNHGTLSFETAPSAVASLAPTGSVPPVAGVDAVDAARDWHHTIRKTFYHDPKFIVISPLVPTFFVCPQHSLIFWRLRRAGHRRRLESDARGSNRTLG
jgi:hypothetical protein